MINFDTCLVGGDNQNSKAEEKNSAYQGIAR